MKLLVAHKLCKQSQRSFRVLAGESKDNGLVRKADVRPSRVVDRTVVLVSADCAVGMSVVLCKKNYNTDVERRNI